MPRFCSETFAAQAVIAIENVRQFKALEARTEEVQALNASLEERVEEQVGEIERMGKLKSFLPAAVADAVVSSGSDKMLRATGRCWAYCSATSAGSRRSARRPSPRRRSRFCRPITRRWAG